MFDSLNLVDLSTPRGAGGLMHSAASTGRTHQGMILIWVAKMAGQGLECGKIKEIWAFFLGKVP
ncbi:hypothetical protein CHH27_18465 [Labrenzia sp. VG12]|nr:hypothetical protein CHH27_18465 [Labrenzia sp. VG12]